MTEQQYDQLLKWAAEVQSRISIQPAIGIIAGTGLGDFVTNNLEKDAEIGYHELAGFPVSTVEGHSGKFVFGTLMGKPVVAMLGRFHHYEGYSMQEVTLPVRLMKILGVETLIVTNAAGGLNEDFELGDLMLIEDHINLLPQNPLTGRNEAKLGPRFPDMSQPYNLLWLEKARQMGIELSLPVKQGVYVAVPGPNLETRAEYRFLKTIGADAVGMSTVPEVIVARHMGMQVLAISVITDLCRPQSLEVLTLEQVLKTAREAAPKLGLLLQSLINDI
jgi:purine-nucleoside phosphorylase